MRPQALERCLLCGVGCTELWPCALSIRLTVSCVYGLLTETDGQPGGRCGMNSCENHLSGIHYHSQAGRTLFSTSPCPGLVLSPRWPLCCSKQDKSKTGLWAKLSSLPAPGSVLYIYCLGAERADGCAQDRNSGWNFSTHLSFLGRQRGDPRSFFIPCSPLTGRRKGPRWRGPLF